MSVWLVGALLITLESSVALDHGPGRVRGSGDPELLSLVSYASRSLREASGGQPAESEFQSIPMLYSGAEDGLLEGPTWAAYWTQNSYGTAMTCLPFLGDIAFKGIRESQNWWFNNQADGTNPYASGAQGWAPDGCSCDNGETNGCNYKQGDGNVPIHDWTLEETLSAVVMQSELLLISRNLSAVENFLPHALRASNLVEGRRDPATGMTAFLSGPSSNLLAPSFGSWKLDNGKHAWSWMTGIVVTYSAALIRLKQLASLVGDASLEQLYDARLRLNLKGLDNFVAPDTRDYFVRSIDPNGTLHGVHGAPRHGYFEASPNHDAVAFGVVNSSMAHKIVNKIKSLGAAIRPNVFILPNTDATGKPSVTGAGGVGYDDMACGTGPECGGIFNFGTWVNGGVWTTTEGRWIMASAITGDISPGFESVRQMRRLYGQTWRMDNPLVDFGRSPYQPDEDINLTVDNFASAGGLLRGLFEYRYTAKNLSLVPHVPDNITSLAHPGARWGPYRVAIETRGVCSSGIDAVLLDGQPLSGLHSFNAANVELVFDAMPPASADALASVNSTFQTAFTQVNLTMVFKLTGQAREKPLVDQGAQPQTNPISGGLDVHDCQALLAAHGLSTAQWAQLHNFSAFTTADVRMAATLANSMAAGAISFTRGFDARCQALNNGTLPPLRSVNASEASLVQMLTTSVSIHTGLVNHLSHDLQRSADPLAKELVAAWGPLAALKSVPARKSYHLRRPARTRYARHDEV